jgi:hypothetical protein
MKKIVRLTESDITRIVKRVMNESPLLLGDPDYESNYRDYDEEDDDDLSDDDFMSKYRDYSPSWDVPTDKKLERMRRIRNKNRGGMGMNEAKRPSSVNRTNLPGGIKKRVIDSLESAAYYTKGTKHSSDNIVRHYINKGRDVVMYSKGNNRIFVEPMDNRVFDENDRMVGKITGDMDDWAMDYFDNY